MKETNVEEYIGKVVIAAAVVVIVPVVMEVVGAVAEEGVRTGKNMIRAYKRKQLHKQFSKLVEEARNKAQTAKNRIDII